MSIPSFAAPLLWRVPLLVILGLIVRLFSVWVYRLTFHPLAKYPGPWLAKVSDLYGAYHNAMGQLPLQTQIGHEKFGPVFRQGPNKLVFNSLEALHGIYHAKDEIQKSQGYVTMVPAPGAFNIFTAVDKSIHRFKRKVLSQGFSDQTLRAFEPTVLGHIDTFVHNLTEPPAGEKTAGGWSQPVNMTHRCRWLQYDVMGEFGFGQPFQLQKSPENRFLIDAVEATGFRAGLYVQYPALQNLKLDKLFAGRTLRIREEYLRLMSRLVKSRLSADKNSQNDLFSFVIDAKDPETGRSFTEDELWAESRFLLIAGADTSSTGLTGVFFYLSAHPECRDKLASEVRNTFSSYSDIRTGPQLSGCYYLRACVDEAMRMSPPISGTLWREVCGNGIGLDDKMIPVGVDVGVNPYAFHHNERLFPDSYAFTPERWIVSENNPKEAVDEMRHAFSPFSLGTRSCAGRNMAYMELLDTMARTIWQYDFRRAEGPLGAVAGGAKGNGNGRHRVDEFQLYEHITCNHDGPFLQFRSRM